MSPPKYISFREQFANRIDMHFGSVVLYETEYKQIQNDAFNAGVKFGADTLVEMMREKVAHGPIQIEP